MYPSQTSLIPVTVALTKFVEERGLDAIFGIYPYWYLGTPYRYLTGPIVPLVEFFLHKILGSVTLFDITIYLVIVSFLAEVVGWVRVVQKLQNSKKFSIGHLAFVILLLILPWRYFYAITLGEPSFTIARNLVPFTLVAFWLYLEKRGLSRGLLAAAAGALILLINTEVLPILVVGLVAVTLAKSFRKGKFKRLYKNIKSSLLLVTCSLLLVTFVWYTPGYWWTVLTNPSIGGASGVRVIVRILDLLRSAAPLFLAIVAVYFSRKIKIRLVVFSLVWILTFGFLTVFRFIGDPDFWMDWTSWVYELEIGAAFVMASNFQFSIFNSQLNSKVKNSASATSGQVPKPLNIGNLAFIILFLLPFYFVWRVSLALGEPVLLSKEVPEGVRSLEQLAKEAGDDNSALLTTSRVFLSGATVFWANALYDINQVRGGVDQAATDPFWNDAAYQLREGSDPALAKDWLETLGVSWVLIHTNTSSEFYHDFRHLNKWEGVGKLIWKKEGDEIYEISNTSLAWAVDGVRLGAVSQPKDGKDIGALDNYLAVRIKPLSIKSTQSGVYIIDNPEGYGYIQVLLAHNSGWRAYNDKKVRLKIEKDTLGNMLIYSTESKEVTLRY